MDIPSQTPLDSEPTLPVAPQKKTKAPKSPSYFHTPTLQRDIKPVVKGNETHMFSEVAETAVITNMNAKNVGGSRRVYRGLTPADFKVIAENLQSAPKNNVSKLYEKVCGKIDGGDVENIAGDDEEYWGSKPSFEDLTPDNAEGRSRPS